VFILLSAAWGWGVDGRRPDVRDIIGVGVCLVGAAIMMLPRPTGALP
jgi:small multidrug resistance family-3 protein